MSVVLYGALAEQQRLIADIRKATALNDEMTHIDQARRLLAGTGYVVARDVRPTFDGLDRFCDGWNAACEAMKGDTP